MATTEIEPGLIIYYSDRNSNGYPIVLLLHGLGATSESWQFQYPALIASGFRVIGPDFRGVGKSTYPGGKNNVRKNSEDVAKLLHSLKISSVHVVGISMGGTVGLQLVLDHPSLVQSLILVNTFATLHPKRISYWVFYAVRLAMIQILGLPTQARYVVNRLLPLAEQETLREELYSQIIRSNPQGYRSMMKSFVHFDVTEKLGMINVPTLVVIGEKDSVVPPEIQYELARKIPISQLVVIPNAGHAVIGEMPIVFNRIICNFLTGSLFI
jgi:3-oxoadipate enol-lactonase